jgi:hypothetical protein
MNPYKVDIAYNYENHYNYESHYINDFQIIEKNIAENILNNADKMKVIIKNIKLHSKQFTIIIKKDETIIFQENINLENNTSSNVKVSYEIYKDSEEILCKYLWIYLLNQEY